ncbi:MAG: hypothetical protein ABEK16_00820 [Candidatus Nanohalobium sp.]
MNVPRRIIYAVFATVLATAAAIQLVPEMQLVQYVQPMIVLGFFTCLVLAAASFYREDDLTLKDKNILMNAFLVAVLVPSLYTAGAFVHQSQTSWSGGEIHWHADYEVIVQNSTGKMERLELIDPENFCKETRHESSYMCSVNDRVGSTEYHEHNDNRIHLEGVFKDREDATLSAFFQQFNGKLTNTQLVYPTGDGVVKKYETENKTLKILVRKGVGNRYWCAVGSKVKAEDRCSSHGKSADSPKEYVISPYARGPSLDDIFVIYDGKTTAEALQDVREDGKYRGFGLKKSGEGYGG